MSLHGDLHEIIHRVHVTDDHTVLVDGTAHHAAPPRTLWDPSATASTTPAPAVCELAALIYRTAYVRPRSRWATDDDLGAVRQFQRSLSSLDLGSGTWSEGWSFERTDHGQAVFSWQGVEFATSRRPPASAIPTVPGTACAVRIPTQQWGLHPGYLMVLGESPWPPAASPPQPMLRVYWNITAAGVGMLLGRLSQALNRCSVPFRIKVADRPTGYSRSDAAVLYLPSQEWTRAMSTLPEVYAEARTELVPQEPMMTLRLAPGVGFAHDPGNGRSFGESCCEHLAQAMRTVHRRGPADAVDAAVEAQFREAGIDPQRPYLTSDADIWLTRTERVSAALMRRIPIGKVDQSPSVTDASRQTEWLDIAAALGEEICRQAYWDKSGMRCTWLSRSFEPNPASGEPDITPVVTTLPSRLYDGLTGVALALAELWALRPEPVLRRTAIAALRTADRQLGDGSPRSNLSSGFYAGTAGVGYAARRVSWLTGADEAELAADALLTPQPPDRTQHDITDLIDGQAGEILALLSTWPVGSDSGPTSRPPSSQSTRLDFVRLCEPPGLDVGIWWE